MWVCACVWFVCGVHVWKTKAEIEIRNRKQKLILAHYANSAHVIDQRLHQSAERQPHYLAKYSNGEHGKSLSPYWQVIFGVFLVYVLFRWGRVCKRQCMVLWGCLFSCPVAAFGCSSSFLLWFHVEVFTQHTPHHCCSVVSFSNTVLQSYVFDTCPVSRLCRCRIIEDEVLEKNSSDSVAYFPLFCSVAEI